MNCESSVAEPAERPPSPPVGSMNKLSLSSPSCPLNCAFPGIGMLTVAPSCPRPGIDVSPGMLPGKEACLLYVPLGCSGTSNGESNCPLAIWITVLSMLVERE